VVFLCKPDLPWPAQLPYPHAVDTTAEVRGDLLQGTRTRWAPPPLRARIHNGTTARDPGDQHADERSPGDPPGARAGRAPTADAPVVSVGRQHDDVVDAVQDPLFVDGAGETSSVRRRLRGRRSRMLPGMASAVDHFRLILLLNETVTAVRQRGTQDLLSRSDRKRTSTRRSESATVPRPACQMRAITAQ
jgi:hypothetical protein